MGSFVDAYGVRMAGQFLVTRPEDGQSCSCLTNLCFSASVVKLSFIIVWAAANLAAFSCWVAFGVEAMVSHGL